jgi:pentatricopeptide repeat protein
VSVVLSVPGVRKTVWLYTAAIRACAKGHKVDAAMALLREVTDAPDLRAQADVKLYTAALDTCEKAGDGALALALLDEMRHEMALEPDEVAYGAAISACRKAGMACDCLRLLSFMVNSKMAPNLSVYNTVLGALCQQRDLLPKAMEVLLFLRGKKKSAGLRPNALSYTQVINALADARMWREAVDLLKKMQAAGHRPDVHTCAKVIEACERNQKWQEALELLDSMRRDQYDFYEVSLRMMS